MMRDDRNEYILAFGNVSEFCACAYWTEWWRAYISSFLILVRKSQFRRKNFDCYQCMILKWHHAIEKVKDDACMFLIFLTSVHECIQNANCNVIVLSRLNGGQLWTYWHVTEWISIYLPPARCESVHLRTDNLFEFNLTLWCEATMNASQLPNPFTPMAFLPPELAAIRTNQLFAAIGSLAVGPIANRLESWYWLRPFYRHWLGISVCISLKIMSC